MMKANINQIAIAQADDLMCLSQIVKQFMVIPRATLCHGRPETDGEHSLHLQFLAVSYAARYHSELDIGKVALYGLVHDFVEVYAQDVNSLTATPTQLALKAHQEEQALLRLEDEIGKAWPELIAWIRRYELLEEKEARFVKCFDKCDPSFSHFDNAGEALILMGVTTRAQLLQSAETVKRRMAAYAAEFPDVIALREELIERVAKSAYSPVY